MPGLRPNHIAYEQEGTVTVNDGTTVTIVPLASATPETRPTSYAITWTETKAQVGAKVRIRIEVV